MLTRRHTEMDKNRAIAQLQSGAKAGDLARKLGVSRQTIYAWKSKCSNATSSQRRDSERFRAEDRQFRADDRHWSRLVVELKLEEELHSVGSRIGEAHVCETISTK